MPEMEKLIEMLQLGGVPHEVTLNMGTKQVWYPNKKEPVCDVICHKYSYGYEKGLLEMMGLTDEEDDVEGYLTAQEIYNRIGEYYIKKVLMPKLVEDVFKALTE